MTHLPQEHLLKELGLRDEEDTRKHNGIDSDDEDAKIPSATFGELGLSEFLVDALDAMAIRKPSEIQRACIPPILEGKNVIGGAKTGSGKTAAFALPILQKLSEDPYGVFAVVLTPTRELTFQIAEQFRVLGRGINLKDCVVVGGLDMMKQAIELSRRPHVIIATPGRLRDHIESSPNAVSLSRVRFLVLDEADRLLSSTFASDLSVIFNQLPQKRQTLLFTATMTENILALRDSESDPSKKPFVYICDTREQTVSKLDQRYVFIPSHVRETYLTYLLRIPQLEDRSTIIFCGRCATAELLNVMLRELGVRCTALHSEMKQSERLASLGKFKAETVRVLIATDVGSRGLDIPTVQLVINYDVPRDPADYIHRVGRTARAGRGGMSLTLVSERDVQLVQSIEERTGKTMEEYEVVEKKVLDLLTEVTTAKRVASMHLHDIKFGERRELHAKKRQLLEGADAKANSQKKIKSAKGRAASGQKKTKS
ncbi:uncharacterized protein VTP21DRAFT_4212 [Calcarisporiella thermophila]|uniref:uncharacterized protein n=1 Tax=Calcarisporiella thermophila TaxID=911321 RepID=UPI0037438609